MPARPSLLPAQTGFAAPPTSYEPLSVTTLSDGHELVLPVHRLRGVTEGPTLGLVAVVHGDETLPNEILRRVLCEVDPADLRGTVLAVPVAHASALRTLTRNNPMDMLDLNRSFPGDPGGWLTEQIADVLTRRFLPELDLLVDFHSGGTFTTVDYVYMLEEGRELALAYGGELNFLAREPHRGSLVTPARDAGTPAVIIELGGGMVREAEYVAAGLRGTLNVMRHFGLLDGAPDPPARQVVFDEMAWIRPRFGGILHPAVPLSRLGGLVEEGELLGTVVSPLTFEVLEELRAPFPLGHLVLLRPSLSRVNPGEFAYMVGRAEETAS